MRIPEGPKERSAGRRLAPSLPALGRAWRRLGDLLGGLVGPVVLAALFFLLITPIGLVTRAFGRDELRIRKRASGTHWIPRTPAGPDPQSFRRRY